MAKWYAIPKTLRMTEREYEANIRGLNILFGAVLGFVLADASELPPWDFALVLFISASIVISILYLAHSQYRLFYTLLTIAVIAVMPIVMFDHFGLAPIPQLQPTLAVWAAMVMFVELVPREPHSLNDKEPTQ